MPDETAWLPFPGLLRIPCPGFPVPGHTVLHETENSKPAPPSVARAFLLPDRRKAAPRGGLSELSNHGPVKDHDATLYYA